MDDKHQRWPTPEPLTPDHQLASFDSGEPSLDEWLRKRALANMALAASRTYVVCELNLNMVAGFYALSMGHIASSDTTGSMRRNMPRHIPAVVIGRLAIDRRSQGRGLGGFLLADAVRRGRFASEFVSARLVLVHAISTEAEQFYLHYGFTRLPAETPTLALDLTKLAAQR